MTSEATLRGLPLPRPSVRIICLDVDGRVLLLQWQDPVTREHLWEPPGGGIEGDETAFAAAQRELHEETGLDPARIHERSINVERDTTWKGQRYVGAEPFFIAHFDTNEPIVTPAGLSPDEDEENTTVARLFGTRAQMDALARHGMEVISRGRPICPLCGKPMDPDGVGHGFCPRRNGHSDEIVFA